VAHCRRKRRVRRRRRGSHTWALLIVTAVAASAVSVYAGHGWGPRGNGGCHWIGKGGIFAHVDDRSG